MKWYTCARCDAGHDSGPLEQECTCDQKPVTRKLTARWGLSVEEVLDFDTHPLAEDFSELCDPNLPKEAEVVVESTPYESIFYDAWKTKMVGEE